MKIEKIDIGTLIPNPTNPRTISKKQIDKLKKSILDFPEMLEIRPIIVDEDMVVLAGNMRLQALIDLEWSQVPYIQIKGLSDEQKKEFIIKDNLSYGEWDWDILAVEWDLETLWEWGVDEGGFDIDKSQFGTDFKLEDGAKEPFQQMNFTLSDEQVEEIKSAIADIKSTEEFKYCETFGNENSNGNALYLIIMQWAEQKKSR